VGVSNCTDGLRLLAHALDIGPGAEVVTAAHTFIATLSPFVLRGAHPVLVDIGGDHLVDADELEQLVGPRTQLIVPVHLNGRVCNMGPIMKAAESVGALVVEDAAQALGATWHGQTSGTFGLASVYSFYPAKLLGAPGDGGAVLTNDRSLAHRVRSLRDHGRVTKSSVNGWGYNCRLDNLHAAILDWRLTHLPKWIDRRRAIARIYAERLDGLEDLDLPPGPDTDPQRRDVFQNYVVGTTQRDDLVTYLTEHGVETLVSWPVPLHHQEGLDLAHWSLPRTEQLCRRVVSLPMHVELDDWQVNYVCDQVRTFLAT